MEDLYVDLQIAALTIAKVSELMSLESIRYLKQLAQEENRDYRP